MESKQTLCIWFVALTFSVAPVFLAPTSSGSGYLGPDPMLNESSSCNSNPTSTPILCNGTLADDDWKIVHVFQLISATWKVLQNYADQVHSQWDDVIIPNCKPPVPYRYLSTDTITAGSTHLANWYSTMVGFSSYLCYLRTTADIAEHNDAQLETLGAILNAIENNFLNLLQGLQCNCTVTDSCSITTKDFDTLDNCVNPVKSVVYHITNVASESEDTLYNFLKSLPLSFDLIPVFNTCLWIEENLDTSVPAYYELLNECD